jgi:arsenical pump membrane protein
MLIAQIILAVVAVGALVVAPRSWRAAAVVLGAAVLDVLMGAAPGPAVAVVAPLIAFLASALTLAALVERSGLAERAAAAIARRARGSGLRLYVLVCIACALLTAAISLDGAVVLMIPLLLALHRRAGAPFAPLFLGAVVVANVVSIAVPQGNPTNMVVMSRLGLSPAGFVAHMLVPGLIAAAVCAAAVAIADRAALRGAVGTGEAASEAWTAEQRRAVIALGAAAVVAWAAPLAGVAPWWPFTAVVAVALAVSRTRPIVPWRIAAQVGGLVIVTQALNLPAPVPDSLGLAGFVALAAAIGVASALANNLPISVWAGSLLASGSSAYAATIGLAVGALATPQGSVATLIAAELAGPCAPKLAVRRLAPLAAGALVVAAVVAWAS